MSEIYEKARAIAEAAANGWDKFGDTAGINWLTDAILALAPTPGKAPGQDAVEALCDRLDSLNTVTEPQACADAMDEAREVILALAAIHATQADTGGEPEDALGYATRLAQSLSDKHFPNPRWRPLPDLYGVLTQIDNMTTGLSRTVPAPTLATDGEG